MVYSGLACREVGVGYRLGHMSLPGEPGFLHMEKPSERGSLNLQMPIKLLAMLSDKPLAKTSHKATFRVTVGGACQGRGGGILKDITGVTYTHGDGLVRR